jgi:hypothetical protein
MSLPDLYKKLIERGIAEDRFYLHGLYGSPDDNDKLSMVLKKGKYAIEYEIYFRERGEKHNIITFTEEDKACNYFFKRLTESLELEQFNK